MIKTIKSRIDCYDYARARGLPVSKPGGRCASPLRPGARNKNSFVVHRAFWYDFGSGTGGDVIDLCALLDHNGDRRAAIHALADRVGVTLAPSRDWVQATNSLNGLIQHWHTNLPPEQRDYLHSRHITDATITAIKLGWSGSGEPADGYAARRIIIPYWKNGYIYSYVARGDNPKYLKRRNDDLSDAAAPWGMHSLDRIDRPLIIAEGAFDALSVWQEGYPVLSPMGGNFSQQQLKTVLAAAKNFPEVILAFDTDGPGQSFALTMAKNLFDQNIKFKIASIPAPHKDISDYYTATGELFHGTTDGPLHLFLASTPDEVKTLARQASTAMDDPELASLFAALRESKRFDDPWLAALQKQCQRAPSEDYIARKVAREHQLVYIDQVGFYEYHRGAWRKTPDTSIQNYIGDAYGYHRTGARLTSVLKILKADCLTTARMNAAPVWNFVNGTLELSDPPVFREHRADDYCSFQSPYPYIPDAYSPEWDKFLSDICDDDERRTALLQEIAGYILFPDCSLEKLFVLQGSGGNGKSVFLGILSEIFGKENGTAITVSGLTQDFQRVYISESMFNIAPEIKSDITGAEEYLKQITSGETISACYKGQNYFQFQPRCKLLFATNGQLKSSDTSDGLLRRAKIVNFNVTFCDNPTRPNERKIDTELTSKLTANMPALFNWALQGYLLLKRARSFTEVEDEEIARKEFADASNPVRVFFSECEILSRDRISRSELWTLWVDWSKDNGHVQGSSTRLYREARKLFPYGTKEVDVRFNGEKFRGFVLPNRPENPPL